MESTKLHINRRSIMLFVVAGCLSMISIAFVIQRLDLDAVLEIMQRVNVQQFIMSTCVTIGILLLSSLRWRILLAYRLPLLNATTATFLGFFVNAIAPFRLGEVVRARLIKRHDIAMSEALPSIVLGQLLDVLVLVLLGILLILFGAFSPEILVVVIVVGGIAVTILLILYRVTKLSVSNIHDTQTLHLSAKLIRFIKAIVSNIQVGLGALNNWLQFVYASILSIAFWLMLSVGNWILLLSLIESPSLLIGIMIAFASGLGRLIPALPGDIGTLDVFVMLSMILLGIPEDTAITIMLLIRVRYTMTVIFVGVAGLIIEGGLHILREDQSSLSAQHS